MCGIFGVIAKKGSPHDGAILERTLKTIAFLSESRGKESSGIAVLHEETGEISVVRIPMPVSNLLQEKTVLEELHRGTHSNGAYVAMGHSRLATNGSQLIDHNNQPVVKDGIVAVHNGIIVNVDELWAGHPRLKREYDIDTEIMLALLRQGLKTGSGTAKAVADAITQVFGTVSTAILFDDRDEVALATNNGSLYMVTNSTDLLVFASERYMLTTLLKDQQLLEALKPGQIRQIRPGNGCILNYASFSFSEFELSSPTRTDPISRTKTLNIRVTGIEATDDQRSSIVDMESIISDPKASSEKAILEYNLDRIKRMRTCTKCLLPETFPHIRFDGKGVCNYCNNHVPYRPKSMEALRRIVEPYRSRSGEPDVIIPYSGGRDSTFMLHMVKKELSLNPIAYTYDWGMVTDLARRNIARVCGKLGVENIIVSADIRQKRENIRKNIQAWLRHPRLGAVPLFMAGDKYFFHYCNQVKEQTGVRLNLWGANALERTNFKMGFAGLEPEFPKTYTYRFSKLNQLRLFWFLGKNILLNPTYINSSIYDTMGSYVVRYLHPRRDYYRFFDYYPWNEKEVMDLIISEYKWETAKDTDSTWRIGDGTASFYDYIYYTVAGFSEIDTFRSNQIREGMMTREEGQRLAENENRPRYESIRWYLETVGLDYTDTISRINTIPKLYK